MGMGSAQHIGDVSQSIDNTGMTDPISRADRIRAALMQSFAPNVCLMCKMTALTTPVMPALRRAGQSHYSVLLVSAMLSQASAEWPARVPCMPRWPPNSVRRSKAACTRWH